MSIAEIKYCPSTLAEGYSTYSRAAIRRLFNGKTVSHILPYYPPQNNEDDDAMFIDNRKRISLSGVQEKMSVVLERNRLRLTREGEQGTYILKPFPGGFKRVDQMPANEHLTMQIASQVYGINTAENGLVFFKDGTPAYLTKRFDVDNNGGKLGREDFASLAGKTEENSGRNFKYKYSYEQVAEILKRYAPAYTIEVEKLFSQIIFNYLFSNGDAHLKNFSMLESPGGDHILSPAYDLVNSRIHVNDTDFALDGGLFKDSYRSNYYSKSGHPCREDFEEFARRAGVAKSRSEKIIAPYTILQPMVEELVSRSFLDSKTMSDYFIQYKERLLHLQKG